MVHPRVAEEAPGCVKLHTAQRHVRGGGHVRDVQPHGDVGQRGALDLVQRARVAQASALVRSNHHVVVVHAQDGASATTAGLLGLRPSLPASLGSDSLSVSSPPRGQRSPSRRSPRAFFRPPRSEPGPFLRRCAESRRRPPFPPRSSSLRSPRLLFYPRRVWERATPALPLGARVREVGI